MDSNLKGTFLCAKFVLPHMIKAGGAGSSTSPPTRRAPSSPALGVHYTATKAGVLGLTRHLAKEYAPHQILVNTVAPGPADVERNAEILSPEAREQLRREIPLDASRSPKTSRPWCCSSPARVRGTSPGQRSTSTAAT